MKKNTVTTLVLPIAGLGTRLLPLTARTPKNLVPVNGRPLIEYVLEEAVQSGIKNVVLIVNPLNKAAFRAYVAKNQKRFPLLRFHVRVQETPGGHGHAVVQAYDLVAGQPFAVRFCDDILAGDIPALRALVEVFDYCKAPIILLEKVPMKQVSRFGVVRFKKIAGKKAIHSGGRISQIMEIVEKPKVSEAPSNLTVVGGYILTPSIMRTLKAVSDSLPVIANDALPISVAFQIELSVLHGKVFGWEFPGKRLDCGTLENLRKAESFLQNRTGKLD